MPNYGVVQAGGIVALQPGDLYYLFNTESPTAPQASVSFARAMGPTQGDNGITFQILFASAPTAVVLIQGSNVDTDADYETVYTSTNLQNDSYTDIGRFAFYRAKLLSQSAGGALSVIASR
jgi:hypothetical protein